ncbi:SIR2 family protein [Leptospira kmetyi]|uniref:P-loop NTPase n=1 Tax=Leptospira kmetyi TaxID=408139 RepID=UPI001083890D|nr:SIR2 family protein [Leptospira kmetyi]TGL69748.1 hypothetical protein EHQ67_08865 [Leptospira kmetyi]
MNYDDLLNSIKLGNSILFTGAGFSSLATNLSNERIPVGSEFSYFLCKKMGIEEDDDLRFTAEHYIEKFDEFSLIEEIKNKFSVSPESCRSYAALTKLPWYRVYTTNYDNLIETAGALTKKKYSPVTLKDSPKDYRDKGHLVIHLNGYVDSVTPNSFSKDFRLTTNSFMWEEYSQQLWLSLFRQDINYADSIVFIGFNILNDIDIMRTVYASKENKHKINFIVREDASRNQLLKLEKIGNVHPLGIQKFLVDCEGIEVPTQHKKSHRLSIATSLEKFESQMLEVSDKQVFDFLFLGNEDEAVFSNSSVTKDNRYLVHRNVVEKIEEDLKGDMQVAVIHSYLANGKSTLAKAVGYRLVQAGYLVYWIDRVDERSIKDVEHISSLAGKKIIIIENYNSYFWMLKEVSGLYADKTLKLILTERTLINDFSIDKVREYYSNVTEYDINQLKDQDIELFVSFFDLYGLWGDAANKSKHEKKNILITECRRSISHILLRIIESQSVQDRIKNILSPVKNGQDFYEAILLIAIGDICSFTLNLEDIEYLLGNDYLNNPNFARDRLIREIIDIDTGRIKIKSSVLSMSIIKNVPKSELIINVLLKLIDYSNKTSGRYHSDLIKKLTQYTNLERMLRGKEGHRFLITDYYEKIKSYKSSSTNPQFWLQYSIAMLAINEFDRAKKYFDTAYSYAEGIDWYDTYQIDNHFARFLLENEIEIGSKETCMRSFKEAHAILTRKNDNMHYTFKVALNYIAFFDRFGEQISIADKNYFRSACEVIVKKGESYLTKVPNYRQSKYVIECVDRLRVTMSKLK